MVILGFLAFNLAINVSNPIWEAIDEPSHFQMVKFVAEHHALPGADADLPGLVTSGPVDCIWTRCIGRNAVTSEPPLYYLLVAPFVTGIDLNSDLSWVANPYFTWPGHPLRNGVAVHLQTERWPYHGMVLGAHVMRAISGLMYVPTLIAIYFAALAIVPRRAFATLAAATAGAIPGVVFTTASINNDNAGMLTGSLALLAGVRSLVDRPRQWLWFGLYAIAVALTFAAKYSAYFLIPVSLLLLVMLARRCSSHVMRWGLTIGGLAVASGIVLTFREGRFNLISSVASLPRMLAGVHDFNHWPCTCPYPGQRYWGAIPNLWETTWGSYGWETFHLPSNFYKPYLAVTLLALAGLVLVTVQLARRKHLRRALSSDRGSAVVLVAFALVMMFAVVDFRYMATHSDGGSTHGRFMFPAILATALLLTLGLYALPHVLKMAGFLMLYGTSLAVIAYSAITLPHEFGPILPVYGDPHTAGARHMFSVTFSNGMQLLGWTADTPVLRPAGQFHIRLFWAATHPPDFDYSAYLQLDDGRDGPLKGADHGPGAQLGLLPHQWLPGEVIPDDWTINIPASAAPGDYQVRVGVYDYRDLKPVPTGDGAASVVIAHQAITAGTSPS